MSSDWETLSNLLPRAADRFGDRAAICFIGGATMSFADLDQRTGRLAGGMALHDIQPGERVTIWLANTPEWGAGRRGSRMRPATRRGRCR